MATYTVKSGDTLSKIGQQLGVDWRKITGFRSGDPNLIYPGEVLTIPGVAPTKETIPFPTQKELEQKYTPYVPPEQKFTPYVAPTPTIIADDLTTKVKPVIEPIREEIDIPTVTPPVAPTDITPPTAPPTDTTDYLRTYLEGLEPPVDPTIAFKKAREEAGILEKQEVFTETQRAVKAAQSELDIINAQIADIVGQTQVRKLEIAKEPISARAIRGRNIVEERNLAIRAIPLQAQALVAQANIASAQGDEIIAQNALSMAQDSLDKVFGMQLDYQESLRTFNNDLRAAVYEFATAREQKLLDAQEKEDDRAYDLMRDQIDFAQSIAKDLLQTQPSLAAKISQIDWSKPQAQNEFARLQRQVTPEVGKLGTQVVEVAGRKLLINTQTGETIRDLGVADGIPDIGGITTLTGKPLTDTQALTFGYGTRMSNANVIISELEDEFTGVIGLITGHKWFPGVFKTEDRLRIEQAERNFINAVLRRESGAAIAPSEFDSAAKQYFPQPGDTTKVLEQKARNRTTVISNFAIAANVPLSEITGQETPVGEGSYEDYLKSLK